MSSCASSISSSTPSSTLFALPPSPTSSSASNKNTGDTTTTPDSTTNIHLAGNRIHDRPRVTFKSPSTSPLFAEPLAFPSSSSKLHSLARRTSSIKSSTKCSSKTAGAKQRFQQQQKRLKLLNKQTDSIKKDQFFVNPSPSSPVKNCQKLTTFQIRSNPSASFNSQKFTNSSFAALTFCRRLNNLIPTHSSSKVFSSYGHKGRPFTLASNNTCSVSAERFKYPLNVYSPSKFPDTNSSAGTSGTSGTSGTATNNNNNNTHATTTTTTFVNTPFISRFSALGPAVSNNKTNKMSSSISRLPSPITQEKRVSSHSSSSSSSSSSSTISNMNKDNTMPIRPRPRPPMLNLQSQSSTSGSSNFKQSLCNISSTTKSSSTKTTTLAAITPSSAVFPALRTPKEIVLQDIAVQCISPALPSFDSSVMDVMARSKSIQEEQRRIIAQRRRDEGLVSDEEDDSSYIRLGRTSSPLSPELSNTRGASCETKNSQPTASTDRKSAEPGCSVQTDLIISESGNFIIEAVSTPTETRISNGTISKPVSITRKSRPGSIKIFPFDISRNDSSIKSAPLHCPAPYSSRKNQRLHVPLAAGAMGTPSISPSYSRFSGPSYQQQQRQQPYLNQQPTQPRKQQVTYFPKHPGAHPINTPPLSAVPTSYNSQFYMNRSLRNSDNLTSLICNRDSARQSAASAVTALHEDDEDNDERDPEDAALSDNDEVTPKQKIHLPLSDPMPGMAKGIPIKVSYDEDNEDTDDLSDVEAKAIAEDDECGMAAPVAAVFAALGSASKKRRRNDYNNDNYNARANREARRKRFIEICGELWDLVK